MKARADPRRKRKCEMREEWHVERERERERERETCNEMKL